IIAAGVIFSDATTSPQLALDLEGGTSIILEPQVSEDTDISKEQLDQAVSIIRQRVDGTGVSEAEITTQGDRNIVVNLPGNPDEETRDLVRSSAQLAFRRVAVQDAPQPLTSEDDAAAEETEDPTADLSDEQRERLERVLEEEAEDAQGGGTVAPEDSAAPQESAPAGGVTDESATEAPAADEPAADQTVPRFDPMTDTS